MLSCKVVACLIIIVCVTKSEDNTVTYKSFEADYENDYENYKDEMYDDEGSRDNGTTQAPVISATNFSYTYAKNVLIVTFVPAFIDKSYRIDLIPENGFGLVTNIINDIKPVVHVTFGRSDIVEYRNYTVVIADVFNEDIPFKSDLLCLRAYKTPLLDCNMWQIGIHLQEDIRVRSITAFFELSSEFSQCFETFTVELGIFPKTDHKRKFCWKDPTVYQRKNVTYNNPMMNVTFEDLPPKHYCVNITARHEDCPRDADCSLRYSADGMELKEFKEEKLPSLQKKRDISDLLIIIVPICVIILLIVIGLTAARKRLIAEYNPAHQLTSIRSSNAKVYSVESSRCKKKLVVPMLNAQDIDQQRNVTMALHNFLNECCHVTSIIGENNPEVLKDNSSWIQNNFDYRLSEKGNAKYKIVILETDAAVRLYQHRRNPEKRSVLKYRQYSHLNDIFLRGLTQLTSSPEFLGPNHNRIVVIHFSYFPESNEIDCFKQKRLYLPHHLVQLYNSLWDENDLLNDKENLLNKWKKTQSYKELLRTIKEMEAFVKNNPGYLDEYVFGDSEVV